MKNKENLIRCCDWHKPTTLPYVAEHLRAEKWLAQGKVQIQCDDCGLWIWKHEFGKKPKCKSI